MMTSVLTDAWINCKCRDRTDCGVCKPEFPVSATRPDTFPDAARRVALNPPYAVLWPDNTYWLAPLSPLAAQKPAERTHDYR